MPRVPLAIAGLVVFGVGYVCLHRQSPATPQPETLKTLEAKAALQPLPQEHKAFTSDSGKLAATEEAKRLAVIANAASMPELEAQLRERDPDVQVAAVRKLLTLPDSNAVIAGRYLELSQAAKSVVDAVAKAPSGTRLREELRRCTTTALRAPVVEQRLEAVRSFRTLSTLPPAKDFSAFLLAETDPQVTCESIDLAGASKNAELHSTLLKLAQEGSSGVIRRHAFENLVNTGGRTDDATLQLACKALSDADGEVRLGAVIALAYQGWDRIPQDARERVKTLAASDTYKPQNATTFFVQDAAKVLVMSGNEKVTTASNSDHQQ